ncbi:MAG: hypothetical protein IJ341_05125 [Bacteroidales bacterium]|nr:hypothetical protein [Bacteroidales bacterium]MBQ7819060.1 hypothetical protein [Bacteroidales bacterium]
MKKISRFLSLVLLFLIPALVSCDDDRKYVDVEYEYQLMPGTHQDITGTISYVDANGNLISGGAISYYPFECSFEAEKGFDNVKMVVTLNPIPEDASVPVQLNQRYKLELEDIERKYTPTQTFQTVQEYNAFCATPQVFAIH